METPIKVNADPGKWVYVQIERLDGQLWNPTLGTPAFQAEQAAGAGWAAYSIQVPETAVGVTGRYRLAVPATIPLNELTINAYVATTPGAPAVGDASLGAGTLAWDGAAAVDLAQALRLARSLAGGKRIVDGVANTLTLYDLDGTTQVALLTLSPAGGPYTQQAP